MSVDWIETDSEAVARFGYDAETRELHVVFRAGRYYAYGPVPEEVMIDLLTASSVGRFVNTRIKPYFDCREIESEPPGPDRRGPGDADRRPDRQRQVGAGAEAGR